MNRKNKFRFPNNKAKPHHRFSFGVVRRAVKLYQETTMSYRRVARYMKLKTGTQVSHKTVYEWVHKFGREVARG